MFKHIFPPTTQRVSLNTDPNVNEQIRNIAINSLKDKAVASDFIISERIKCLNAEWDVERFLEANAASLIVASTVLGLTKNKCWFFLTGAVGFFLLTHALQGWCPPLPLLRKFGVRTAEEINHEKIALKMLRLDFADDYATVEEMLQIAERQ